MRNLKKPQHWEVSPILCFGDTSDETTGMAAISEYGDVVREMHETL
jgi:hypothetical protein